MAQDDSTFQFLLEWSKGLDDKIENKVLAARRDLYNQVMDNRDKVDTVAKQLEELNKNYYGLIKAIDETKLSYTERSAALEKEVRDKMSDTERNAIEIVRFLQQSVRGVEERISTFMWVLGLLTPIITLLISVLVKKFWK